MEVQVLEALQDSIISISVILMRSLGKLLFFGCALKCKLLLIPLDLTSRDSGNSFHYAGSLLFVLCKFLPSQCLSPLT